MTNKLTLTEYLAKRICDCGVGAAVEGFAEELAIIIHEDYQDEVDMTDNEWNCLLGKLEEFIDNFLLDDAEKLAKEWTKDNEDWDKEIGEASRGQY